MTDAHDVPPLPDPVSASDRGFLLYGGSPVQTSRGRSCECRNPPAPADRTAVST